MDACAQQVIFGNGTLQQVGAPHPGMHPTYNVSMCHNGSVVARPCHHSCFLLARLPTRLQNHYKLCTCESQRTRTRHKAPKAPKPGKPHGAWSGLVVVTNVACTLIEESLCIGGDDMLALGPSVLQSHFKTLRCEGDVYAAWSGVVTSVACLSLITREALILDGQTLRVRT